MFHFIHTYLDRAWEGVEKNGLWSDGDGIKLMHKTYLSPDRQFNAVCAEGSPFYSLIKEKKCPFYIDRYQGGIPMPYKYGYDYNLLEKYREMLGDNFWGFQLHEWASNYASDSMRIKAGLKEFLENNPGAGNAAFWEEKKKKLTAECSDLFVEAFTVDEWSRLKVPDSVPELTDGIRALWSIRMQELNVPVFPADSYFMAPKIEIAGGAKRLMPESGWQIPDMRIQLAYTRGMARAAGIPFGTYYECWCCQDDKTLTIPYSSDDYVNEWYEDNLLGACEARSGGRKEQGGSARSLQERAWLYSYFSGGDAIGEEYGVCNTFRNYRDFELSEYGMVKKRFIDFTRKYPDLGTPFTPVAVVLPAELEILPIAESENDYLRYPVSTLPPEKADKIGNLRKTLRHLLTDDECGIKRLGSSSHVLQNGKYPDIFDIIHGDMTDAVRNYPCLIDLTGNKCFAEHYRNRTVAEEDLASLLPEILPVTLSSPLHYLFCKTENGFNMLILNENGVDRLNYVGDVFFKEAAMQAEILPGFIENPHYEKLEGEGELSLSEGRAHVSLTAGQWLLLHIS